MSIDAAIDQEVYVEHVAGDRFDIGVRSHVLTVDQPVADGGADEGPTPTELFVASLAACVGFYVRRFLLRHGLEEAGLQVRARFTMAQHPARVGAITVAVALPSGIPAEQLPALRAVASHCTVHNSLVAAPEVHIELASAH